MSRTSASKAMATIAGIGAMALVMTACGSSTPAATSPSSSTSSSSAPAAASGGGASSSAAAPSSAAAAPSSSAAAGTGGAAAAGPMAGDDATYCDFLKKTWPSVSGKSVGVYSSITGDEATQLVSSWKDFTACTGTTVKFNGDKNFETQVVVQAKSGNASDIAFVPQPGLLAQLVATGKVSTAPDSVAANVDKYWDKGWKGYGTINGKFYAAPLGANVKSLVWYSPKTFKAKGYTVPKTWDEMIALSDKIAATGEKPWCAGVESGTATGWTATDWLEEVVLRQAGPDVYDQWVSHKVKFADPQIAAALKTVGSIWKNPKYMNGGIGDVNSIATTPFTDGGLPVQTGKCYLHQQASFYATNFKGKPVVSETGDLFAFYEPSMGDKFGKPVEVGGEFVAAFNNRPEVQAFQWYLTTAHWANNQSKAAKSRISANKGLDVANVPNAINKLSVSILQDPKAVSRFDASDLMPAAVGSGAEWKQLTAWITGADDASTLAGIDAAWPAS